MVIDSFSGNNRWLSNFYPCIVSYEGLEFHSVEHAYQAAKTTDLAMRAHICMLPRPQQAKHWGRRVVLRPDWESVKQDIMLDLLQQKFSDPELRELLDGTGDAELIEGNWWGDTYWGVCNGVGENHLGKLLMRVRSRA